MVIFEFDTVKTRVFEYLKEKNDESVSLKRDK